jgi:hypothetical protein
VLDGAHATSLAGSHPAAPSGYPLLYSLANRPECDPAPALQQDVRLLQCDTTERHGR